MRTFANFIFLGNTFNAVPQGNLFVKSTYSAIFKPTVEIVAEDCGTKLGLSKRVTTGLVNKVQLKASGPGTILTLSAVQTLSHNKIKFVPIRSVAACTAPGGICRRCMWASPELYGQTVPTLSAVPAVGSKVPLNFTSNTTPFLSYLSKSFSGSVTGSRTYLNDRLPLREELLEKNLSEGLVASFTRAVTDSGVVGPLDLEYASNCNSNLEKCLFLLYQYSVGYTANVP